MRNRSTFWSAAAFALVAVCLPASAGAQMAKSAAVAKELVQVMDQKKLDSIATKIPSGTDVYAAALYFPNVQLLVISGRYTAPHLMEPRLAQKQYKDTYMELSGTVTPDTRVFVQDMGEPGLSSKRQDGLFDTWTQHGKPVTFDGDPDAQKMSDADYQKAFHAADEEYAKILSALLVEAKK
jgi:hypothetical protein